MLFYANMLWWTFLTCNKWIPYLPALRNVPLAFPRAMKATNTGIMNPNGPHIFCPHSCHKKEEKCPHFPHFPCGCSCSLVYCTFFFVASLVLNIILRGLVMLCMCDVSNHPSRDDCRNFKQNRTPHLKYKAAAARKFACLWVWNHSTALKI